MPRGRPKDPLKQQASKQALQQAARDLLEEKPYRSISIRELAERAGTQSAMVSYYFGSKEGLFIELLQTSGDMRHQAVSAMLELVKQSPRQSLPILVDRMIDLVCSEPWLVRLLQDEVLGQDSQLRDAFMQAIPKRLSGMILQLLAELRQQQVIRADLNLTFTTATLMSNILFPLISEPLMKETLGIQRSTLQSDEWKQHVTQVLTCGLTNALTDDSVLSSDGENV